MVTYSIIQKSQLEGAHRVDAEYYQPEFIEMAKTISLNRNAELRDLTVWIKKGIFDLSPDHYRSEGIPFMRTLAINDPLIDFSETVFLDRNTHLQNKTTTLFPGDLVFTKIGANIGKSAILPSKFNEYNFSQNVAGAKIKQDIIKSGYLLAYLLSRFGKGQIDRAQMISGQSKLEIEDLRKLKIVIADDRMQQVINNLVNQAQDFKNKSLSWYLEAEDLLLEELGLGNFRSREDLSFVANLSGVEEFNRIDSDFFQPKYQEIIEKIENYNGGFDLVKNQFKQNKSLSKKDKGYYNYVEISDVSVSNGEIILNKIAREEIPANGKITLYENDLLISKVRPYRGAVSFVDFKVEDLLGSGAFTVLQEKTEYRKEVLMIFLKLDFIKDLLLRYNCGTSYPVIKDEDILNLKIPLIRADIQKQITELVRKSHEARIKSKELLEEAKKKVEEMIENSGAGL